MQGPTEEYLVVKWAPCLNILIIIIINLDHLFQQHILRLTRSHIWKVIPDCSSTYPKMLK